MKMSLSNALPFQSTTIALIFAMVSLSGCADNNTGPVGPQQTSASVDTQVAKTITAIVFNTAHNIDVVGGQTGVVLFFGISVDALEIINVSNKTAKSDESFFKNLPTEKTCECSPGSCTFQECLVGTTHMLDGTIAWTSSTLVIDSDILLFAVADVTVNTDLAFTGTTLNGTFESSGELVSDGTKWTTEMTFSSVSVINGVITGGNTQVSASITTGGVRYSDSASITF